MLSIDNVSESRGAFYYEKEDYYSRENSPAKSEFLGKGAQELGLVDFDDSIYKNLLLGLTPDGSKPLAYYSRKPIDQVKFSNVLAKSEKKMLELGLDTESTKRITDVVQSYFNGKTLAPLELHALEKEIHHISKAANLDHKARKNIRRQSSKIIDALRNKTREAAYDLTFSAPKSVSIQLLVNGDQRILNAHQSAVRYALQELETRVVRALEGPRHARKPVNTKNMIIATFPHGTSREGDPQLHTHSIVFNMTLRSDGKWRAISNEEFYRQAKLGGMIYQNHLAQSCKELGYDISIKSNGTFEISGFKKQHLEQFSTSVDEHVEARIS